MFCKFHFVFLVIFQYFLINDLLSNTCYNPVFFVKILCRFTAAELLKLPLFHDIIFYIPNEGNDVTDVFC